VPLHNRDLERGTLHSIIKQAGLTEEEFLGLL
jgi:predicted RNA binding protein YcfA (HicA-like mRNA interferase family)